MTSGINVGIGADTREFERATRDGLVDPIDDAQKALDDYVRKGVDAGGDMSRSFESQQRSTTELRSDIDRLNDSLKSGFRNSTRTASSSVDEFEHRSKEGFNEIKDSARSNAIEVGASFTGGMDQAIGGVQGFLAEFLAGFGPGGVIAGVGIAALLGVISQKMTEGTESAEAQQQAVADLAGEYIEAGAAGKRSFDSTKSAIEAMATSKPGDVILTLQQAWDDAKLAGGSYQDVVRAIATTNPQEIERARQAVGRLGAQHERLSQQGLESGSDQYAGAVKGVEGARRLDDALGKAADQARSAARAQKLAAEAGLSQFALKAGELGQLEQAFDDTAGAVDGFLNKEKDTLNVKAYLSANEKREKSLEKLHDAYSRSELSPAALKFLETQGADTAAAMLRGYEKATPAQQRRLEQIWTTAGNENATDYQDALGKKLDGITYGAPKVERPVIPAPDSAALDRYLLNPKRVRVMLEVYDRKGQRVY